MRYDDILEVIAQSDPHDWNRIADGPLFLYGFPDADGYWTHHGAVAVYKPDVSIGLAWGLPVNDDFKEEWANRFDDSHASSHWVDVFFNRQLIHRDLRVLVDGARVGLPAPERDGKRLVISSWQHGFFGLIQGLAGGPEFDGYLRRAGIEVA
jgi:hypothetical protein